MKRLFSSLLGSGSKSTWATKQQDIFNLTNSIQNQNARMSDSLTSHIISIHAGKNNTIVHCGSHPTGSTLLVTSAGNCGLKTVARGTSDAGFQAAALCVEKCAEKGIAPSGVHVKLKG